MSEYVPKFSPGDAVPMTTSADVTGGQLLEVSGDGTVAAAAASSVKWVGVAGFDAASGERVTVFRGGVQRPTASGAIDAGDQVVAAASGKVATAGDTPAAGSLVGVALSDAADGDSVTVQFN